MKKQLAVLGLAVAVGLGLGACGKDSGSASANPPATKTAETTQAAETSTPEASSTQGLPNPQVEVDSPDAFKDQLGLTLQPEDASSDRRYTILDGKLAQADYTLDGAKVTARVQKTSAFEDLSGIYDDLGEAKVVKVNDVDVQIYVLEGQNGYAAWYNAAAGVSGSVAQETGASVESLTQQAEFYVNQESKGL
ncbi:MAG: hypothetical protein LBR27_04665 [Bifidobacteriaceae bacterium]|jgi:hypothetical protein|nr:hypothetical protein [Bifidobacteriaceae bacterium]